MRIRPQLRHASWTLIDQGIVSAGMFAISILLARWLPPADYGIYGLLLGAMFGLQLVNATLLFHPLSVLLLQAPEAERPALLRSAVLLVAAAAAALGLPLGLGLLAFGLGGLVLPALACFLLWQLQEAMRRGLLAGFRHRAATLGDLLSYPGQVVAAGVLAALDALSLASVLYALALTSGLAALLQARQLGLRWRGPLALRPTLLAFWSVGGFWSLGNGLLAHVRMQVLPWALAIGAGPAAAAGFQAALNIVNLSNPFVMGLCNLIPQAAARAAGQGMAAAWRGVRVYLLLAAPPLLGFSLLVLAVPEAVLRLVYGEGSAYLGLATPVRLLVLAVLFGSGTELVVAFLHGVRSVPAAFLVNAAGALTATVLALAAAGPLGIVGCGLALLGANLVRLGMVHMVLTRALVAGGRRVGLREIEQ
ncbi:hypothetical protein ACFQY5_13315 [Paeniroseomonas aquatica]|uniref:Polysaccharide biosynthesis protein C-terminal domain-containing protein n=1 Tax=Paeniroseomonas aquatica TaxID=373043 RepID=A0ABT8AGD1_9PROT|nr:hypothetical protein [Paeniroseomonas aquatica]MDN3568884.1 hypothetical protein [Paeniroseomonas aquatica]